MATMCGKNRALGVGAVSLHFHTAVVIPLGRKSVPFYMVGQRSVGRYGDRGL